MPEKDMDMFSNPLPPSTLEEEEESEAAQKLTNADFRKLLMTPRAGSEKSTPTPSSASMPAPAPVKPKTPVENEADDAAMRRKKKKIYYAKLKKMEEERQQELEKKYRDRAKERRDGSNKDYEETEIISTTADYRAVAPDAKAGETLAERRKQLIQESKYLGGDMEHTHLVKGLDYALLDKVRAEIVNAESAEVEIDKLGDTVDNEEEPEEDPEDKIEFKTKLGRNIYRTMFKSKPPLRNELFLPGRMAYVVDIEDEYAESDIPTTSIKSKADCPNVEATTTLSQNDIVINKLTQILSYLRQGKRDRKMKKKDKGKLKDDRKTLVDDSIYGEIGDYIPNITRKTDKDKGRSGKESRDTRDTRDKGDRDRRDRDRDRRDRRDYRDDRDRRDKDRGDKKKSYFEKPADEDEEKDKTNVHAGTKEFIKSINEKYGAEKFSGWTDTYTEQQMMQEEPKEKGKKKKKNMDDSYIECYPGIMDTMDDSDDEVDYTKMDQGNKKGPVGRWDFDTQEEYSDYMSNKEALPKAAFQYGVKMADGRRTRRTGPKDEKKELDREWQKIQNIINKRKQMGTEGPREPKMPKY